MLPAVEKTDLSKLSSTLSRQNNIVTNIAVANFAMKTVLDIEVRGLVFGSFLCPKTSISIKVRNFRIFSRKVKYLK